MRAALGKPAIQSSGQNLRLWAIVLPWGQVCSLWICLGLRHRESGSSRMAASLSPRGLTSQLDCSVPEAPRGGLLPGAEPGKTRNRPKQLVWAELAKSS